MIDLAAIFSNGPPVSLAAIPEAPPTGDPESDAGADLFVAADFEALPEAGDPCPKCGGIMVWWDLLGGRHCQLCEADGLRRSLDLAALAIRLRTGAKAKPAPQDCAGGPSGPRVDTEHPERHRPVQGPFRGLCGVRR